MSRSRRALALSVLVTPVLLIMFDLTVLGIALPALSQDLRPSADQQLWIVDVYSFVLAGLLVVMGNLGDRIGRRRLLTLGAAAFGIASALAAFAPTPEALIAARALLGVGGATLMPSTLSLIKTVFVGDDERRRAVGVWSAAFVAGVAAGPVLGGVLLEHFWWGSVFLLNVPLVALILIAVPFVLPESRDPSPGRFDLLSAALSLAAMLPLVYVIKTIATHGVGVDVAAALVIGLGSGWWFLRRQRTLANPLLDLTLLRRPAFASAVATNLLAVLPQVGLLILVPQYLQLVVGLSPLTAALWMFPGAVIATSGALLAARLARRVAPHRLVAGGLVVAGIGTGLLALVAVGASPLVAVFGVGLGAIAIAVVQTLTVDHVLAAAPEERAGAASAISETGFELGGALGVTILGTFAAVIYTTLLPVDVPGQTLGETLGATADPAAQDAARDAFTLALAGAGALATIIMIGAAIQALRFLDPRYGRTVETREPAEVH